MEEIRTSVMFYFHFSFAGQIDPEPEMCLLDMLCIVALYMKLPNCSFARESGRKMSLFAKTTMRIMIFLC